MAMTVMNNPSAMMSLGELNKNVSKLGKDLAKVASGQKIVGAGDGASEYAISERMRVRKRALDRDEANVQTGISLLNVAAGGIQQQIEIMKNIKAKVIDADNDSNTDLDRMTIQKEISQGFEHINDIAYETNYNGKLLLVGNKEIAKVTKWEQLPEPREVPDSDLQLIPDTYPTLDGINGPFEILPAYSSKVSTAEPLLGTESSVNMTGGTPDVRADPQTAQPATFTMDFSAYTSAASADGLGFFTAYDSNGASARYYVLTTDPSKMYHHGDADYENVTEIDISGCNSAADIANTVANAIKNNSIVGNTSVSGAVITATTARAGTGANTTTAVGWQRLAEEIEVSNNDGQDATVGRTGANPTGLGNDYNKGNRATNDYFQPDPPIYEDVIQENWISADEVEYIRTTKQVNEGAGHWVSGTAGTQGYISKNISTVDNDSGFAIQGSGGTAYVRFEHKGSGGAALTRDSSGVYTLNLDREVSETDLKGWYEDKVRDYSIGINLSYKDGQLTLITQDKGGFIKMTDGFPPIEAKEFKASTTKMVNFEAVRAYPGPVVNNNDGVDAGPLTPGNTASYTIDLSSYDTTDSDALNNFIDEIKGKVLNVPNASYEFVDTTVDISFDAMKHSDALYSVDLKDLRNAVQGGQTIADAFISMMTTRNSIRFENDGNNGLKINASVRGELGNNQTVSISEGILSAYTIDFKEYLTNNPKSIPADFYDKGFRVYCATCPEQWMNFHFINGQEVNLEDKPESISGADFKTTFVDISGATDMKSLVQAIYDQGGDGFEHMGPDGKSHYLHFAADPEAGKLTVYDERRYNLFEREAAQIAATGRKRFKALQEKGAKLADGLYDDVQLLTHKLYVNDLIIHHTDKASMNIHLQIPQTSMDHIFGYNTSVKSYKDFDVLTVAHREELLGNQAGKMSRDGTRMVTKNEPGLLDNAIQYLADAATLVGAQTSRLETTHDNIITQQESTAASESTIRDADMAKEMTAYTKSNILTQAAQSMLAQANQNSSSVLSLLQ